MGYQFPGVRPARPEAARNPNGFVPTSPGSGVPFTIPPLRLHFVCDRPIAGSPPARPIRDIHTVQSASRTGRPYPAPANLEAGSTVAVQGQSFKINMAAPCGSLIRDDRQKWPSPSMMGTNQMENQISVVRAGQYTRCGFEHGYAQDFVARNPGVGLNAFCVPATTWPIGSSMHCQLDGGRPHHLRLKSTDLLCQCHGSLAAQDRCRPSTTCGEPQSFSEFRVARFRQLPQGGVRRNTPRTSLGICQDRIRPRLRCPPWVWG